MEAYNNLPPLTKAVVWIMSLCGIVGIMNMLGLLSWNGFMMLCACAVLCLLLVCAIFNIEEGARSKIWGAFETAYHFVNDLFLEKLANLREEIAKDLEKKPA